MEIIIGIQLSLSCVCVSLFRVIGIQLLGDTNSLN